jgi:hypothetical protein
MNPKLRLYSFPPKHLVTGFLSGEFCDHEICIKRPNCWVVICGKLLKLCSTHLNELD